jgi:hypothetical protein
LKRVLLCAALMVYTAAFVEMFIRIFDPQPVMPRYITGTAWGVRGNIPGAHYWHHTPEVDVEYRINRSGLRADREYPFEKPAGICRLGLFGDSFFFGVEANLENSFAGQLERRLRDRGFPVEVLNFAVGGFGTTEMLRTYQEFGSKFDLDVVVFSWDFSDMNDNLRSHLYRLKDDQLVRADSEYLPGVHLQDRLMRYGLYRLIADHSQFYSFARERISLYLRKRMAKARKATLDVEPIQPPTGDDQAESDAIDTAEKQAVVGLSSALVLFARDVVTASGSDFYLVDIPVRLSRTQFSSSVESLPPDVRSRLSVITAVDELSKAARPDFKLFYEQGQGHLTPTGNAILVEQTVRSLESSARLQACASPANKPTQTR